MMTRRELYNKCNGHCAYCGREMEFDDMTIDHIHPQAKGGGNGSENLLPSCQLCNNQKGDRSVEEFRELIRNLFDIMDESKQYRLALRYGLVNENPKPIKFYYEELEEQVVSDPVKLPYTKPEFKFIIEL